jgi:hypothetical protein
MAEKKLTAKEQMEAAKERMAARRKASSAPRKASVSKEVVKPSSAKESMDATSKRMAARRDAVNSTASDVKSTPTKTTFGTSGLPKSNPLSIAGMSKSMTPSAKASTTAKPAVRTSTASGPPNTQKTAAPKPSAAAPTKSKVNPLGRKLDKNGAPIIGKAELEKSGLSLGAFLNRERKLTSRVEPLKELEEIDVKTGKKKMAKGGLTRKKK